MQSKCVWLNIEEETNAFNNSIGCCKFKSFQGQTFMMATKKRSIFKPPPPLSAKVISRFFYLKIKEFKKT